MEVVEEESVGVVEVLLLFHFELFLLKLFQWRHSCKREKNYVNGEREREDSILENEVCLKFTGRAGSEKKEETNEGVTGSSFGHCEKRSLWV